MDELLMEPLRYYEERGKEEHQKNISAYFDRLVLESKIDVKANKQTVDKYKEQTEKINTLDSKISKFSFLRILSIIGIVISVILILVGLFGNSGIGTSVLLVLIGIGGLGPLIFVIVKKINPILNNFNQVLEQEKKIAEELLQEAQRQTAPLNALFDDNDTKKLIEQTIPDLAFDMHYSRALEDEFKRENDFENPFDEESSIVNTLSGKYKGNPFLYTRHLQHTMGTEVYTGELEISWVEVYTDSDGNTVRRRRYQTLTASVEKPKPYYSIKTMLHYGCQGAPALSFSRNAQHTENLSDRAVSRKVKSGEKELQKLAREATKRGDNFTEMANSEFDVLFGASDRNDEVQFRMMFTPLAQTNTVNLMRSHTGFGDDFDFIKQGRWNVICSEHAQTWNMNTSGSQYHSHDIDEIRQKFFDLNNQYFKSLFFDFAPLLSIPLYQQKPVKSLDPPDPACGTYPTYEYEVLANCIGAERFAHSKTETDAILKATYTSTEGAVDRVSVKAYSYRTVERIDYISVLGGDNRYHNVPVPWLEYIPLTKTSSMAVTKLELSEREYTKKAAQPWGETVIKLHERSGYVHGLFGCSLDKGESIHILDSLSS